MSFGGEIPLILFIHTLPHWNVLYVNANLVFFSTALPGCFGLGQFLDWSQHIVLWKTSKSTIQKPSSGSPFCNIHVDIYIYIILYTYIYTPIAFIRVYITSITCFKNVNRWIWLLSSYQVFETLDLEGQTASEEWHRKFNGRFRWKMCGCT